MPVDWETLVKVGLIWLCGCFTPLVCGMFGYVVVTTWIGLRQVRRDKIENGDKPIILGD